MHALLGADVQRMQMEKAAALPEKGEE